MRPCTLTVGCSGSPVACVRTALVVLAWDPWAAKKVMRRKGSKEHELLQQTAHCRGYSRFTLRTCRLRQHATALPWSRQWGVQS